LDFNDIIGQKFIKDVLLNSIKENRVSHAYVFEGPKGIGKRLVAKIYADALACSGINDAGACGKCINCTKSKYNSHPDIKIISDVKSIKIETVREIIKDMYIKPYIADKKIYIIEDADKLTLQAQNSLLKVLEEPPEYGVMILTTYSAKSLLQTIQSRTVLLKFKSHNLNDIKKYLNIKGYKKDNVDIIAAFTEGTLGEAEKIAGWEEFENYRNKTKDIIYRLKKDESDILKEVDFFVDYKNDIDIILRQLLFWLRDIFLQKECGNSSMLFNRDEIEFIKKMSQEMTMRGIILSMEEIINAKKKLKLNGNFILTIESMLLKCFNIVNV
jgi:DNA polymerase-3 subunit delta'